MKKISFLFVFLILFLLLCISQNTVYASSNEDIPLINDDEILNYNASTSINNEVNSTIIDVDGTLPFDDYAFMSTPVTENNRDYYFVKLPYKYNVQIFYKIIQETSNDDWDYIAVIRYALIATEYDLFGVAYNYIYYLRFNIYANITEQENNTYEVDFVVKITKSAEYKYSFMTNHVWTYDTKNLFGLESNLSFFSPDDIIKSYDTSARIADRDDQTNMVDGIINVGYNQLLNSLISAAAIPGYEIIKMIGEYGEVIYLNYIKGNHVNEQFIQNKNLDGLETKLIQSSLNEPLSYSNNEWDLTDLDPTDPNDVNRYDYYSATYIVDSEYIKDKELYINVDFSLYKFSDTGDALTNFGYPNEDKHTITIPLDYSDGKKGEVYENISIPSTSSIDAVGGKYNFVQFIPSQSRKYMVYHTGNSSIEFEILDQNFDTLALYSVWNPYNIETTFETIANNEYYIHIKTISDENFDLIIIPCPNAEDINSEGNILNLSTVLNRQTKSGSLNQTDPYDFYSFTPSTSSMYTFDTNGISNANTYIELFHNDQLIAKDDNSGNDTYDARINIQLSMGETYYLSIKLYNSYMYGNYQIEVFKTNEKEYTCNWLNISKSFYEMGDFSLITDFYVWSMAYDIQSVTKNYISNDVFTYTVVFNNITWSWSVPENPFPGPYMSIGMVIGETYPYGAFCLIEGEGYQDYQASIPNTWFYTCTYSSFSITFNQADYDAGDFVEDYRI